MMKNLRTIPVSPDSDLAHALKASIDAAESFFADTGTARYCVSVQRADALTADQIARTVAGMRRAAGAWAHHDGNTLQAAVRARRRSGSQPSVRW